MQVSTHRLVFVAPDRFDEVVRRAQVAIVTKRGWHIYGGKRAHSFDKEIPLPDVACPIVDLSPVDEEHEEAIAGVIGKYITESGVIDLPALLGGLVALGAKVTNRPCPQCEGTTRHCDDCQFLEEVAK